ncbi:ATP-binding protein [Massilia sp. DWR3-1-1]|uniref:ATP-binding protein n=1 Tax=Massilia sp. DWR3-1-1 TaxID=2804559 RepID=UPI003CED4A19
MNAPLWLGRGRRWSLRRTLLSLLLGLTLLLWGVSALIVYFDTQQESEALFDQSLSETAHLLLSLADHEVQEHAAGAPLVMATQENHNHRQYLLFQIWSADQRILYRNAGAPLVGFAGPGASGFSWARVDGQQWRVYASWNSSRRLQIQVAEPAAHRRDISTRFALKFFGFALLAVSVAGVAIWWSVNQVFRVLQASADEVALRTPNDLAEVSLRGAPDELAPLLLAINRLFGRVRQTMAHEQRFTADAAHELRTPLAAIKTSLQVIERARNDGERLEFIASLGVSVDRATRLVDQLLTLARLDPLQASVPPEQHDMAVLLAGQVQAWRASAGQYRHSLQTALAPATCPVHPELLLILVRNLLDNAFRYTPPGGTVVLACHGDGAAAWVSVSDSGPGIAPAMRERVFERFFRLADANRPGSGLGLSIVRRIADVHGATVSLSAGPDGRGLAVTVRFATDGT